MEASKKRRRQSGKGTDDNEPPLDLLSLYQSDIGDRILSFASGADLCKFDALNKQFKGLTKDRWKVVTKDRFGMNNGKEGWRLGTSFLRPPVFIHLTDVDSNPKTGDSGYGFGCYPGNSRVATNESIIVAVVMPIVQLDYEHNGMSAKYDTQAYASMMTQLEVRS